MTDPVVKKPAPKKRKRNYLNNKDLLEEYHKSVAQEKMTDKLANMLQLLCLRYSKKANFANYTYVEDMASFAMLMLCQTWKGFNPEKSTNIFGYYTQCVKNSFIQYLNAEKKQRNIRDSLLVENGLNPSFGYQIEQQSTNADGSGSAVYDQYNGDYQY